jgi:hypothetical protein
MLTIGDDKLFRCAKRIIGESYVLCCNYKNKIGFSFMSEIECLLGKFLFGNFMDLVFYIILY